MVQSGEWIKDDNRLRNSIDCQTFKQYVAFLSQIIKTGRPNLCLIYRVPVARGGEGVTARRGQLRKPEQQVSAEVMRSVKTPTGMTRWRRRTRYTCLVLMLSYEKLVVNRDEVPRRRGRQYNGDGQVVGGLLFARHTSLSAFLFGDFGDSSLNCTFVHVEPSLSSSTWERRTNTRCHDIICINPRPQN